jgi:hypothetical protein
MRARSRPSSQREQSSRDGRDPGAEHRAEAQESCPRDSDGFADRPPPMDRPAASVEVRLVRDRSPPPRFPPGCSVRVSMEENRRDLDPARSPVPGKRRPFGRPLASPRTRHQAEPPAQPSLPPPASRQAPRQAEPEPGKTAPGRAVKARPEGAQAAARAGRAADRRSRSDPLCAGCRNGRMWCRAPVCRSSRLWQPRSLRPRCRPHARSRPRGASTSPSSLRESGSSAFVR